MMESRFNDIASQKSAVGNPHRISNLTRSLMSEQQLHDDRRPKDAGILEQAEEGPDYNMNEIPNHHSERLEQFDYMGGRELAGNVTNQDKYIPLQRIGSRKDYSNISESANELGYGTHGPPDNFPENKNPNESFTDPASVGRTGDLFNPNSLFGRQNLYDFIPPERHTPTVTSNSYTAKKDFAPYYQDPQGVLNPPYYDQRQGRGFGRPSSLNPLSILSTAMPTTNVSRESVNPPHFSRQLTSWSESRFQPSSYTDMSNTFHKRLTYEPPSNSLATNIQQQHPWKLAMPPLYSMGPQQPTYDNLPSNMIREPEGYMTYFEFLRSLSEKDSPEEEGLHLNIVEYPVNDLIMMLACLLNKIIEANDKLHPNHFENTIAIRQQQKEKRQQKRIQRMKESLKNSSGLTEDYSNADSLAGMDYNEDETNSISFANVLAFHGTNIPGISLHTYLARVLKYCPVTNEVFLSLLVYFDRIARRANNAKSKTSNKDDDDEDETPEQLFVIDSYNIHRLIVSGITVSSKFCSDIFYKNLRYAKVGGLPLEELNYLELQFLLLLDFKLMISVVDLQSYADLLLKFWKREQTKQE